jgi:hypothetical protein
MRDARVRAVYGRNTRSGYKKPKVLFRELNLHQTSKIKHVVSFTVFGVHIQRQKRAENGPKT